MNKIVHFTVGYLRSFLITSLIIIKSLLCICSLVSSMISTSWFLNYIPSTHTPPPPPVPGPHIIPGSMPPSPIPYPSSLTSHPLHLHPSPYCPVPHPLDLHPTPYPQSHILFTKTPPPYPWRPTPTSTHTSPPIPRPTHPPPTPHPPPNNMSLYHLPLTLDCPQHVSTHCLQMLSIDWFIILVSDTPPNTCTFFATRGTVYMH